MSYVADGQTVVASAGTAVQLAGADVTGHSIWLSPLIGNANQVVVGASTVVAATGTRRGIHVATAQSPVRLEVDDIANLYIDSLAAGDGVSWVAILD